MVAQQGSSELPKAVGRKLRGSTIPNEEMADHIANHEASHAVAAIALGWEVTGVTVEAGDGRLGLVTYGEPPTGLSNELRAQYGIIISYAGSLGEQLMCGSCSEQGLRQDEAKAEELAPVARIDDPRRLVQGSFDILRHLFRSTIRAVARALRETPTLTREELLKVVRANMPSRAERRRWERRAGELPPFLRELGAEADDVKE